MEEPEEEGRGGDRHVDVRTVLRVVGEIAQELAAGEALSREGDQVRGGGVKAEGSRPQLQGCHLWSCGAGGHVAETPADTDAVGMR